jgi:hypothetical protein
MKFKLDKFPATKFCKVEAALGPCSAIKDLFSMYSIVTSLSLNFSSLTRLRLARSLSLHPAFTTTFLKLINYYRKPSILVIIVSSFIPPWSLVNKLRVADPAFNSFMSPTHTLSIKSVRSFPCTLICPMWLTSNTLAFSLQL